MSGGALDCPCMRGESHQKCALRGIVALRDATGRPMDWEPTHMGAESLQPACACLATSDAGIILQWNTRCGYAFRLTARDALGKSLHALIAPAVRMPRPSRARAFWALRRSTGVLCDDKTAHWLTFTDACNPAAVSIGRRYGSRSAMRPSGGSVAIRMLVESKFRRSSGIDVGRHRNREHHRPYRVRQCPCSAAIWL